MATTTRPVNVSDKPRLLTAGCRAETNQSDARAAPRLPTARTTMDRRSGHPAVCSPASGLSSVAGSTRPVPQEEGNAGGVHHQKGDGAGVREGGDVGGGGRVELIGQGRDQQGGDDEDQEGGVEARFLRVEALGAVPGAAGDERRSRGPARRSPAPSQ